MKRILCLWLPSWPLQRLVAGRPELKGRVIILHARDSRHGGYVVACSRAAYQRGIRPGIPLGEAMTLQQPNCRRLMAAPVCSESTYSGPVFSPGEHQQPNAPYLECYSPESDWKAIEQLAIACEAFSPTVGFESVSCLAKDSDRQPSPSSLYLDVTNLETHFGSDSQLADRVAQWMHQQGYHVRIGLADTLGAAWAAAHFGSRWATQVTPDASYGNETSASAPPPSQSSTADTLPRCSYWVIPAGATNSALKPLPTEALRLPRSIVASLQRLGIFQIYQLAQLPRTRLATRFGPVLFERWDQAFGMQDELLEPYRSAAALEASILIEHPTTHRVVIRSVLEQLIQQVSKAMVAQGKGAMELLCRIQCAASDDTVPQATEPTSTMQTSALASVRNFGDSKTHQRLTLRIGLFCPTARPDHLMDLIRMQMDSTTLSGPVEHVSVRVTEAALLENRQQSLLLGTHASEPHQLPRLVDRLRCRLGFDRVATARLLADAQPEHAYRYTNRRASHAVSRHHHRPTSRSVNQSLQTQIRPLFLRSPPIPLAVVAISPDGPPIHLTWERYHHRVIHHWGPERIETGWWRGRSIRRDYYRIEVETGARFWLYRQLDDGQWFLHGEFG